MTYKLNVTETNKKSGKFHYTVTDENGNVISERKSNRVYVACTASGSHYFGRLDLIGKGDHGSHLKYANKLLNMSETQYYKERPECVGLYEQMQSAAKQSYDSLSAIAYK
jgi:2',3'-cyclic-nucleotide 2'-phosphodiesterase (5'-nucleotidase family)